MDLFLYDKNLRHKIAKQASHPYGILSAFLASLHQWS